MYPSNNNPQDQPPQQPDQAPAGGFPPQPPQQAYQPQGFDPNAVAAGQPAPPQPPMPAPAWQPGPPQQSYQQQAPNPYGVPSDPTAQLPQPQAMPPTPQYNPGGGNGKKKLVVALIAFVVLAIVAVGGYFAVNMLDKKVDTDRTNSAIEESRDKSEAQPLDELRDITLVPPHDLTKYTANDANTATAMAYVTADGNCQLQLGVHDAATLPGADLADIVAKQLETLRSNGVEIDAPVSGDPIELKDATANDKTYTMPTLTFTAKEASSGLQVRSHYSAAVLADGKRAFVTRVCQNTGGAVSEDTLKQIDTDAADVTVKQ